MGAHRSRGRDFGVVTRFLFRSPDGADHPRGLSAEASALPRPPRSVLTAAVEWPWESLGEADFARIVRNHGDWHARDEADGDGGYDTLYSGLYLNQRCVGRVVLSAQIDGTLPDAEQRLAAYAAAVNGGVAAPHRISYQHMPWLDSVQRDMETADPPPAPRARAPTCGGPTARSRSPPCGATSRSPATTATPWRCSSPTGGP